MTMEGRKIHKFEIRPVEGTPEDHVSMGANTRVLMDGKELEGVTKITVYVGVKDVARIHLEMVGQIDVKCDVKDPQIEVTKYSGDGGENDSDEKEAASNQDNNSGSSN